MEARKTGWRLWASRLGWLLLFWVAGVALLGAAAVGIRLLMRAAGST